MQLALPSLTLRVVPVGKQWAIQWEAENAGALLDRWLVSQGEEKGGTSQMFSTAAEAQAEIDVFWGEEVPK
jgi:hypothetical protein